jgi:glycine oxidase
VTSRDGGAVGGLIVATGFFRHGVLLAPLAADITLRLMDGHADHRWNVFRPGRFMLAPAPSTAERIPR